MTRVEGKDVGTFVHHGAEVIGVARTVDCARTNDSAVEHPRGVLRVNGKEEKLAARLDQWRRAGLMSDELYRERILRSGRTMTLREINEAHRIKFKTARDSNYAPFVLTSSNNGGDDPNEPGDRSWPTSTKPTAHGSESGPEAKTLTPSYTSTYAVITNPLRTEPDIYTTDEGSSTHIAVPTPEGLRTLADINAYNRAKFAPRSSLTRDTAQDRRSA